MYFYCAVNFDMCLGMYFIPIESDPTTNVTLHMMA